MNRRGFFSGLGSLFKKRGEVVFFGLQIVVNVYGEDAMRDALHRVLASGGDSERPSEKRAFYKRISALLMENQPFFEYGFWDYVSDADAAEAEFEGWVSDIEGSMATEIEELGQEIDEVHRMSSDKSYVVVSALFLIEAVPSQENFFSVVESIQEDDYLSRDTFGRLIEAINYIDFEYVHGDAAFIMPGSDVDGISWEDIHGEGWQYLKPVM
jgi:hypothetical protein